MDREFKDYLVRELEYLRESVDDIKNSCVHKDEYETNKKTVTGWIIGIIVLLVSIVFGFANMLK